MGVGGVGWQEEGCLLAFASRLFLFPWHRLHPYQKDKDVLSSESSSFLSLSNSEPNCGVISHIPLMHRQISQPHLLPPAPLLF